MNKEKIISTVALYASILILMFSCIAFFRAASMTDAFVFQDCACSNCSLKHADFEGIVFQMHEMQHRVDVLWGEYQDKELKNYLED